MSLKNRKILVTGADGFIGSHLVEELHRQGARIRALALYNSFNDWGWLEDVGCKDEIDVISGDIRDLRFCQNMTRGIDIVFHLAALIAIPYSYTAPDSYLETNIKGTLNVCQACLDNGVSKVIHTSTSEVYGTAKYVPIDESHPMQPQSPYSASKIGADAMAMSFHYAFGLPLAIARPFNTYGPRQSARAIIPSIIIQLASGSKRVKLGDVRPTRDFSYVLDTCRGMIGLCSSAKTVGQTVNIGSNSELSIKRLFETIQGLMGTKAELVQDKQRMRPEKSEVKRLWCDNLKIRKLTGYRPATSMEEGLKRTIDWFMKPENLRRYKAGLYNV